ncbi:MAG: hypothetical protein CHACPFDD_00281 [Phycisphaerae bacterium]|nr:hypothetical protein [Phycisphaerae bacterium]
MSTPADWRDPSPHDRWLYQGPKFSVRRTHIADATGDLRDFDYIVHSGAAVILPILDGERIVMIRNVRPATGETLLELPAGTIDPPESPPECARREIEEETGYRAGRMEPLLAFYSSPGICNERMHAFVARELSAQATRHEPMERIEVVVVSWAEVWRAIADGRIRDGKTLVTLLYYDRLPAHGGAG